MQRTTHAPRALRLRALWAAMLAVGALLFTAGPALASSTDTGVSQVVGGKTVLTTAPGIVGALTSAGVGVAFSPVLDSKVGRVGGQTVVSNAFRVIGGSLDLADGKARLDHAGRITFTRGSGSLTVGSFRVTLGAHPQLSAVVDGGPRVPVFDLDLSAAAIGHGRDVVRVDNITARLTPVAAGALNGALHTSLFAGGLTFGTARTVVVVAS